MGEGDLHSLLLQEQNNEDSTEDPSPHHLRALDWLGRSATFNCRTLGGKRTLLFTAGTVCLWHIAFFGIFFNVVLFFKDVLGEGSGVAARDTNNWLGSMFLASLLGAFIAESFLGRLWTCVLFQSIALVGTALMMIVTKVLLSVETATVAMRAFFYICIYLLSIGYGAFVPALRSLGADQFDTEGERAIFFTRYVILDNVGMALADTVVVYVVSAKGWLYGFGLAATLGAVGLVFFALGIPFYRQYRPQGNPYRRPLQVLVLPTDSDALYWHEKEVKKWMSKPTDNLRWLNKAAVITPSDHGLNGSTRNGWKLSSVTEVEEMKAMARLIPLSATVIFLNTLHSQTGTLLVEEGALMNTSIAGGRLTMEPATMNLFNILVVVLVARCTISRWCR